jgi:DNA modification methylase
MKAEILVGDVRSRLAEILDKSVQCVVTSPPYWGLRDYGTASWDGGNPDCDHKVGRFEYSVSGKQASNSASAGHQAYDVCPKCGATRIDSQIGLEQTPQEYVAEMVSVFREVWRVLADDGVLWLNLGDSYTGSGKGPAGNLGATHNERHMEHAHSAIVPDGLKRKELVGIPWRVAFALQDDGWYLRQDIIWAKPNPMPESVRDRCTKSHEYIFMLTKQPRYYFDNEAIKEPSADLGKTKIKFGGKKYGDSEDPKHATKSGNEYTDSGKRNKRDVWTIPTKPFKGAHFAVMPEAIVEPCVLASSRPGDTVLDPFTGSGTVAVVALRHGRNYVGTELNPEYADIAINRITEAVGGLINDVVLS